MFEGSTSRNGFIAFLADFVSLIKAYPTVALTWGGSIPLWAYFFVRGPLWTAAFALQAYFLTMYLLVDKPFRIDKRSLREWWFWKAMLCCIPVHVAILAGLFYWDHAIPTVTGYSFSSRLAVAGGPDIIIHSRNHLRSVPTGGNWYPQKQETTSARVWDSPSAEIGTQ
jgi:hypothetical protein